MPKNIFPTRVKPCRTPKYMTPSKFCLEVLIFEYVQVRNSILMLVVHHAPRNAPASAAGRFKSPLGTGCLKLLNLCVIYLLQIFTANMI